MSSVHIDLVEDPPSPDVLGDGKSVHCLVLLKKLLHRSVIARYIGRTLVFILLVER